jgi:hypothetical protein
MLPTDAFADGGAVRASQRHGNHQITVFTDPAPLRAGPIDVSVLVQDVDTGEPVLGNLIDIEVAPHGISPAEMRCEATGAAASNKLLQAANFNLPHAGWWQFTVNVRRTHDIARIQFELEASEGLPAWRALWLWFCWPFAVIAVFAALHSSRIYSRPTTWQVRDRKGHAEL